MDLPRPLRDLTGPDRRPAARGAPVVLPRLLDIASERWWGLTPRARAVVGALVVVGALALVGRGATASPWGPPTEVLVAVRDLPAGHALTMADAEAARWPADLVPDAPVTASGLGGDLRLAVPVARGAPLAGSHLVTGLAGMLVDGQAAVPLPSEGLPTVAAGTRVDVVAGSPDGLGTRVATDARVLAVEPDVVWLGVPLDRVDAVAAAGAAGRVTLAVRPAAPP